MDLLDSGSLNRNCNQLISLYYLQQGLMVEAGSRGRWWVMCSSDKVLGKEVIALHREAAVM